MKEKFNNLSKQAQNSLRDLYRNAPISSVKMALQMQGSVRTELQEFFGVTDLNALAMRCSTFCNEYGL